MASSINGVWPRIAVLGTSVAIASATFLPGQASAAGPWQSRSRLDSQVEQPATDTTPPLATWTSLAVLVTRDNPRELNGNQGDGSPVAVSRLGDALSVPAAARLKAAGRMRAYGTA